MERASQVKRMNEIYRKAWTPIIWLGSEMEGSDEAMALTSVLAHTFTGSDQVNALTQALHRNPEQFGVGVWRAIHQLINRRYWSRMWILQEAVCTFASCHLLWKSNLEKFPQNASNSVYPQVYC